MLNLKKVIALVCVFALTLTTVAFGATYTDVTEDSAYYEAVETLNKMEIITGYEDGTFKPEDGVTRAEMAALIARIQGYGETAKPNANTAFTDVPASHWASGYIANAAGMGIINGYGDGTFGPEDPVLYEQAVKMIMATLGYTPFAEKNGGYPTGYLAAAQRYDVSLAVANAAVGSEANRGTVAQLLVNALDTPLMVQSKWNTNGEVEYTIAEGVLNTNTGLIEGYKTLMSENLGYVKFRGVIVENSVSALSTGTKNIDTTADVEVKINITDSYGTENKAYLNHVGGQTGSDKAFLVGDTNAEDLLGYSVIGYVKNIDDKFEIISLAIDTARTETLTIALDQFAGYANNEVSYYKDGDNDASKAECESTLQAVYNGVGTAASTALNTNVGANCTFGGEITLIDNDITKGYDVAIIKKAAPGVVKKVTEDGINFWNNVALVGGSTKTIEIDVEDETKIVEIRKDGEVIEATELNEYDVLSIYAVNDASDLIIADVVSSEVVGTITSKKASKTSNGGSAFKVADAWYDVANGAYGLADMDVSEGGTFYIDEFGKIAAFVEDSALAGGTSAKYAYILGMVAEEADFGGTGVDVKVQMLTADGVEIANLKSNARFEQASNSTPIDFDLTTWTYTEGTPDTVTGAGWSAISGGTNATAASGIVGQVVQYVTNSNGYITKITQANHDTDKFKTAAFTLSAADTNDNEYDADNSKFTGGYVDSDAIVFIVDAGDVANCRVGTLAELDHEGLYEVENAYADKKAEDTNIIVVDYDSIKTSTTSSIAVMIGAGESTNDEGEAIWSLVYLLDGEEVSVDTTADVATGTLPTEGDIVKVKVGSNGLVTSLKTIFDFNTTASYSIRNFATNAPAIKDARVDSTKEKFYGGVVTAYKETSTEATILTQVDDYTDSNYDGTADDTESKTVKLSRANNIYVVDATGRTTVIKNGSDGNFKYFEALYGTTDITVYDVDNKFGWVSSVEGTDTVYKKAYDFTQTTPGTYDTPADVAEAQGLADHVYVRMYDNRPTDVIIVKGADIKVR